MHPVRPIPNPNDNPNPNPDPDPDPDPNHNPAQVRQPPLPISFFRNEFLISNEVLEP